MRLHSDREEGLVGSCQVKLRMAGFRRILVPALGKKCRRINAGLNQRSRQNGSISLNLTAPHIKIDKSFTQAMARSESDRAIVTSLVDLAPKLGFEVVAEGVETEAEQELLQELRCDEGQGYLFGKPVPAEVFAEKFLLAHVAMSSTPTRVGRRR